MSVKQDNFENRVNMNDVIACISKHMNGNDNFHGLTHCQRVERNVHRLKCSGVNMTVARLFAYFHDACRSECKTQSESEHGLLASELVLSLRNSLLKNLSDDEVAMLSNACKWHTTTFKTGNPTIDTCFDADKLDLWRIGAIPMPGKMATSLGWYFANNIRLIMDEESNVVFHENAFPIQDKKYGIRISSINKEEMFMGHDWSFEAKSVEATEPGIYAIDLPMFVLGFDWYFRLLIAQSLCPANIRIILLQYSPSDVVSYSRADELSLKRANIMRSMTIKQFVGFCKETNCFDIEYTGKMIESSIQSSKYMQKGDKTNWVKSMFAGKQDMRLQIERNMPFSISKIRNYHKDVNDEIISLAFIYDRIRIMYYDRKNRASLYDHWRNEILSLID